MTGGLFDVLATPVVALLLGYVGGATIHTTIAYVTIKREARRSRTEYMALVRDELLPPVRGQIAADTERALIAFETKALEPFENRLDAAVVAHLSEMETRLVTAPADAVGPALEAFLRSEAGKQWAVELAGVVAEDFEQWFTQKTTSAAGAVARNAQSQIERLLDANFRFDNPILDGLWGSIDKGTKRQFYSRVSRMFRKAGFVLVPTAGDLPAGGADASPDDEMGELESPVELPPSWAR